MVGKPRNLRGNRVGLGKVRLFAVAATLAAALALGACAHAPAPSLTPGARYVSLGSSFAAGAGISPRKHGTPERCDRSERNYATLLAQRLSLTLDDQGCGGATTAHVTGPWNELPPQIDAVTADTKLVTITIGGNDVSYVGYLFMASCPKDGKMSVQGREFPCVSVAGKLPTEDAWTRAEAGMDAIARAIRTRAPSARVVFVQYVAMLPDKPCASATFEPEALEGARQIAARLAAMTERVATRNGALTLPMDQIAMGKTTCDTVRLSNGVGAGLVPGDGAPWHPTAIGHAAIADALMELLAR